MTCRSLCELHTLDRLRHVSALPVNRRKGPTLANPVLHPDLTNFGQSNFGQFLVSLWGRIGWGAKPRKSGGPEGWGPEGGAPKGGAPKGGAPKCGAPEVWGPEGRGPEGLGPRRVRPRRVGAQNFALFFPLPPQFLILFPSLLVFFVEFWWCFEAPGRSNAHVWSSLVVV